jgi:hypothetical protein
VKTAPEDFRSSIDELKARYPELAGKVKKDIFGSQLNMPEPVTWKQ